MADDAPAEMDPAEEAAWEEMEALSGLVGQGFSPITPSQQELIDEMCRRIQAQHDPLTAVFPPRD